MKKRKAFIVIIGICLAFGVIGFFLLTWLEARLLEDYERKDIVVCRVECPAGTVITENNIQNYFIVKSLEQTLTTEDTYNTMEALTGCYPNRTLSAGEIVYRQVLNREKPASEGMRHPIELSVSVNKDNSVAGRIRKGDQVSVYVSPKDSMPYEPVLTNVTVINAYDSSFNLISMDDDSALAVSFTVYVEEEDTEQLLGQLYSGSVAVVKIK